MYTIGMYGNGFNMYRFDAPPSEIAVPAGSINRDGGYGWDVDYNCDVWSGGAGGKIRRYAYPGINLNYNTAAPEEWNIPAPFNAVERVKYIAGSDVLYISGWSGSYPNSKNDWGRVGRIICRFNNWKGGNRIANATIVLDYTNQEAPKAFDVAGDYIFAVACKEEKMWVYNNSAGNLTGIMLPGPEVNNKTGWVDVPFGTRAFKRSNGEYVILNEEDLFGKVIMYRWCPTGNCTENTLSVSPSSPTICSGQSTSITVSGANTYTWSPSTGLSSTVGNTVTANPSTTTSYTITGKDAAGVTKTIGVTVTVNSIPSTPSISKNSCNGLTSSSASDNQWYLNGSIIPGATSQYYSPTQTGNYTVEVNNGGCKSLASNVYTYNFVPLAEISGCANAINIDGKMDETAWSGTSQTLCKIIQGTGGGVTANFKTSWDNQYLYIGVDVTDASLNNSSVNIWDNSGVEIYLDMNNGKTSSYETNDFQYIIGWNNTMLFEKNNRTTGVMFKTANKTGGYISEVAIPWSTLSVIPANGITYGFDMSIDVSHASGIRTDALAWSGDGNNFQNTSKFGILTTSGNCTITSVKSDDNKPDFFTIYPNPANDKVKISFVTNTEKQVSLKVSDMLGREILTILDKQNLGAGQHEYDFVIGVQGIYFVQLSSDKNQIAKKIIINH
ncbi:MAG: T9SS type A sorting domain-containing protein [Bacteroidetes bacterium]|nr:T9SS type A sorting domain-containing protein [Bacteroidota bacterium]